MKDSQTNIHWRSLSSLHIQIHPRLQQNKKLLLLASLNPSHCTLVLIVLLALLLLQNNQILPAPPLHPQYTAQLCKSEWIWRCLCWEDRRPSSSCKRNITHWRLSWWKSKWKSHFQRTEVDVEQRPVAPVRACLWTVTIQVNKNPSSIMICLC